MPSCLIEACVARFRNEVWRVESRVDVLRAGDNLLEAKSKVEP